MPKILSVLFLSLILFSCVQDEPGTQGNSDSTDLVDLQNQVQQLEQDNAQKDSVINESLAFFNEIKGNLEAIGIRKDEIRAISDNAEISPDDKQWILQEIQHINFLREENASKLKRMQDQVENNGIKIAELEIMIESLMKDIQWKDEQISMLQSELDNLDREYSVLFDAYQEQAVLVDQITDELNSVYYAYGSEDELIEGGVIEKKNGFLGIGRKTELREDLNNDYFTKANATRQKSIYVEGTDLRLITYHPQSSYTFIEEGERTLIQIKDASEFWKISKYMVVIVD
ncbi:MAG: hypothetical protein QNK23_12160 [Crocinitomicaceae bacterium]|nr:hypothetical protein [Crocinitomicaceae bacterium]